MKFPFRENLKACVHPETYKYFFDPGEVVRLWDALEGQYGVAERDERWNVMEIQSRAFSVRAPASGNPVTVIRGRTWTESDEQRLHSIMGFHLDAE